MILVVDSTALALLVNPDANPPLDPSSNQPVSLARERIEKLITDMDAKTDVLVVPTPVLAEVLVRAGQAAPEVIEHLSGLARVRVRPFDERAAVELAAMTLEAIQAGDKRGGHDQPWQKVKLDRQIIAIARVNGASMIYADDEKLVKFADRLGMKTVSTWDLPLPEIEENLFTVASVPIERKEGNAEDAPDDNG